VERRRARGGTTALASGTLGVLAGLFAFTSSAVAQPRPGDLDPSFSGNGVVLTQPDGRNGIANDVAIGDGGRIVVAGSNGIGFALARYLPNGKLDRSFSGDGMRSTAFPNAAAGAGAVAVFDGGAIIAVGSVCRDNGECRFAITRYKANGRPWRSFGPKGRVTIDFGGDNAFATSVAIDPRNHVLVGGTTCDNTHCDFALASLKRNGELLHSFGNEGKVVTRFDPEDPTAQAGIADMEIDSRNRILVGGEASHDRTALARYKKGGHLSRSFGNDGVAVKNLDRLSGINAIALTPREKIVAVGRDKLHPSREWALARFGRSGGLDDSFGDDGQVTIEPGGKRGARAQDVAIDSRNRIVATGAPQFSVIRLQPNGHVNGAFGHFGKVRKSFGFGHANAVAIDDDGRPVVAGWAKRRFATARFVGYR